MTGILLIDNYDSFVYNIAQYLGELGASITVLRNDAKELDDLLEEADGYVISPGPGHPRGTRRSLDIISNDGFGRPILGVCLGHQAIAFSHGGSIVRADEVLHGKISRIIHDGSPIFEGVPSPFMATRYHSLIVSRSDLPESIDVIAESERGEIMGLQVRGRDIFGLQFHPESVLTSYGKSILSNFLEVCRN